MNIENKTVLVTGSTDGVGRLVARRLADQGARVLIHGRDRTRGCPLSPAARDQQEASSRHPEAHLRRRHAAAGTQASANEQSRPRSRPESSAPAWLRTRHTRGIGGSLAGNNPIHALAVRLLRLQPEPELLAAPPSPPSRAPPAGNRTRCAPSWPPWCANLRAPSRRGLHPKIRSKAAAVSPRGERIRSRRGRWHCCADRTIS